MSIVVKANKNNTCHRFSAQSSDLSDLSTFSTCVSQSLQLGDVSLTWIDEDGDVCSLSTDCELEEAVRVAKASTGGVLKVSVVEESGKGSTESAPPTPPPAPTAPLAAYFRNNHTNYTSASRSKGKASAETPSESADGFGFEAEETSPLLPAAQRLNVFSDVMRDIAARGRVAPARPARSRPTRRSPPPRPARGPLGGRRALHRELIARRSSYGAPPTPPALPSANANDFALNAAGANLNKHSSLLSEIVNKVPLEPPIVSSAPAPRCARPSRPNTRAQLLGELLSLITPTEEFYSEPTVAHSLTYSSSSSPCSTSRMGSVCSELRRTVPEAPPIPCLVGGRICTLPLANVHCPFRSVCDEIRRRVTKVAPAAGGSTDYSPSTRSCLLNEIKSFDKARQFKPTATSVSNSPVVTAAEAVHNGITCDGCSSAIAGVRYKCANCVDYDLCERCEARGCHTRSHIMLKLYSPATQPLPYGVLLPSFCETAHVPLFGRTARRTTARPARRNTGARRALRAELVATVALAPPSPPAQPAPMTCANFEYSSGYSRWCNRPKPTKCIVASAAASAARSKAAAFAAAAAEVDEKVNAAALTRRCALVCDAEADSAPSAPPAAPALPAAESPLASSSIVYPSFEAGFVVVEDDDSGVVSVDSADEDELDSVARAAVDMLSHMGFDYDLCIAALNSSDGDLQAAVNYLLSNSS